MQRASLIGTKTVATAGGFAPSEGKNSQTALFRLGHDGKIELFIISAHPAKEKRGGWGFATLPISTILPARIVWSR
jgi:hypothetical protein